MILPPGGREPPARRFPHALRGLGCRRLPLFAGYPNEILARRLSDDHATTDAYVRWAAARSPKRIQPSARDIGL